MQLPEQGSENAIMSRNYFGQLIIIYRMLNVCMHVCMYVCMHVCMYEFVCLFVC